MDMAYPRPQMVREHWQSLNGTWKFTFDNERRWSHPSDPIEWTTQIEVPYSPESNASGIGDHGFHRGCWYEREVEIDAKDGRVLLHFGAVDYSAQVWVNGHFVARHEGEHTPFHADITRALQNHGLQTVTVHAEDDPHDLAKPRGKQDWQAQPHSIWYPRTTGIWQTVWIERVPRTYIQKLRWTPYFDGFEIGCETFICGDRLDDLTIEVKISHNSVLLADDRYKIIGDEAHRKIAISDPGMDSRNELLWCPERPTLLDVKLTLWHQGKAIDKMLSYTALRSVTINRDRFMLNGRPYQLRLVLDQGYWLQRRTQASENRRPTLSVLG